eukprot:9569495-Lingulodinium_polyedra.AAC.1
MARAPGHRALQFFMIGARCGNDDPRAAARARVTDILVDQGWKTVLLHRRAGARHDDSAIHRFRGS